MNPHFSDKGLNVIKEVNFQLIVAPWMTRVTAGRPYVFQQDGVPAHTANLTQSWMSGNFPDEDSYFP